MPALEPGQLSRLHPVEVGGEEDAVREADVARLAEVEWRRFGSHPVVRSNIFDGTAVQLQLREFLLELVLYTSKAKKHTAKNVVRSAMN